MRRRRQAPQLELPVLLRARNNSAADAYDSSVVRTLTPFVVLIAVGCGSEAVTEKSRKSSPTAVPRASHEQLAEPPKTEALELEPIEPEPEPELEPEGERGERLPWTLARRSDTPIWLHNTGFAWTGRTMLRLEDEGSVDDAPELSAGLGPDTAQRVLTFGGSWPDGMFATTWGPRPDNDDPLAAVRLHRWTRSGWTPQPLPGRSIPDGMRPWKNGSVLALHRRIEDGVLLAPLPGMGLQVLKGDVRPPAFGLRTVTAFEVAADDTVYATIEDRPVLVVARPNGTIEEHELPRVFADIVEPDPDLLEVTALGRSETLVFGAAEDPQGPYFAYLARWSGKAWVTPDALPNCRGVSGVAQREGQLWIACSEWTEGGLLYGELSVCEARAWTSEQEWSFCKEVSLAEQVIPIDVVSNGESVWATGYRVGAGEYHLYRLGP